MSSDKPFTETMQLDEFGIEPHNSYSYGKHVGGIALSDSAGGFTLLREEARVLYEYLKRHFEQSDRERLKRFYDSILDKNIPSRIGARADRLIYLVIDEFLKSE